MNFKVGDRVRVFGAGWIGQKFSEPNEKGWTGTVSKTSNFCESELTIKADNVPPDEPEYVVHPKQCRKLIPKKRKSIWIQNPNNGFSFLSGPRYLVANSEPVDNEDWIEFREVKKK